MYWIKKRYNSKTMEIYTHIKKKGMNKIKSPLDDLELCVDWTIFRSCKPLFRVYFFE